MSAADIARSKRLEEQGVPVVGERRDGLGIGCGKENMQVASTSSAWWAGGGRVCLGLSDFSGGAQERILARA